MEISWDARAKINRPVQVRIMTANRPGILATIGETFHEQGINISEATCRAGDDGRATNTFTFLCSDLAQLKGVIRQLQRIPGVMAVERTGRIEAVISSGVAAARTTSPTHDSSAESNSAASWKRCRGSFCSARITTSSSVFGMGRSGAALRGESGVSRMCLAITTTASSSTNGARPLSIW